MAKITLPPKKHTVDNFNYSTKEHDISVKGTYNIGSQSKNGYFVNYYQNLLRDTLDLVVQHLAEKQASLSTTITDGEFNKLVANRKIWTERRDHYLPEED